MLSRSGVAGLAAVVIAVAGLVTLATGGVPATAQQGREVAPQERPEAGRQHDIPQLLHEARVALERQDHAGARAALLQARLELERQAAEAGKAERDAVRRLIEAALAATENAAYAAAWQTVREAEATAAGQLAELEPPSLDREPPSVLPGEVPSRGIGGDGGGWDDGGAIRAARLFAGPGQYPPEAFAAYGILAFRARASSAERDRHVMLCEAYVAALPRSAELAVPVEEQMVTIWPVVDDQTADELNTLVGQDICTTAVGRYGLPTALRAIEDAGEERLGRGRRGPFLLAWSPAADKGKADALMLIADLSDVTTDAQAEAIFVLWRTDIEANPEYWSRGWDVERLRVAIRLWVDRFGSQIFSVLGG